MKKSDDVVLQEPKEMIYRNLIIMECIFRGIYKGYEYMIISYGYHPCAYIKIPEGHTLYDIHYDDIDIDCHGGLTFSNKMHNDFDKEPNNYWIGWDYSHCDDYAGYLEEFKFRYSENNYKRWTTEEIINECKNVIEQIIEKY